MKMKKKKESIFQHPQLIRALKRLPSPFSNRILTMLTKTLKPIHENLTFKYTVKPV